MTRVSLFLFFFFKQKTAYEMRISDWSSDVCSSDLVPTFRAFLDGDYAVWAKANQKAHKQNLNRLATAFKPLLDKRLDDITGLDVERWRAGERSEERRVGKECVTTCRSRCSAYHYKKK